MADRSDRRQGKVDVRIDQRLARDDAASAIRSYHFWQGVTLGGLIFGGLVAVVALMAVETKVVTYEQMHQAGYAQCRADLLGGL